MKKDLKRRDFVNKCFKAGVTCCALVYGNPALAQDPIRQQPQKPDPKNLNYCGYKCSAECPVYKATIENSPELKKKAYEEFKMKEKYNIDFDPDRIFCYGCKQKDKPVSVTVNSCSVRRCAIGKGYDCCIECNKLTVCDKELWKSLPQFREAVIKMQKSYKNA